MKYTQRQMQIIETAIELVAKGGIQELTIKNVAAAIGISEPAIYRHFESKMAILVAIQEFFSSERLLFFSKVLDDTTAAQEKITRIMEHHFSTFSEKPALAAVMFSEELFQNDRRLAGMVMEIMDQSRAALTDIVTNGQSTSDIRADIPAGDVVTMIMGSLRLIVKNWHLHKHSYDLRRAGQSFMKSLETILAAQ